jgi:lipopolysaccharide export system protein LptC
MNRLALSIILIFSAALALYVPIWMEEEEQVEVSDKDAALVPNYQALNLRSKIFDKNGQLTHQVSAAKMEHYDLLEYVNFEQPEYTIYLSDTGESWQLVASEGTFYDNNRLELATDVVINSQQSNDYIQTISTDYISFSLDTQELFSDQPVAISGSNFTINSIGFSANLETQQYELKKHVETEYLPTR